MGGAKREAGEGWDMSCCVSCRGLIGGRTFGGGQEGVEEEM